MWAGSAYACLVWAYFQLPEFKGRSQVDIDMLFAAKVPAREWKDYQLKGIGVTDGVVTDEPAMSGAINDEPELHESANP